MVKLMQVGTKRKGTEMNGFEIKEGIPPWDGDDSYWTILVPRKYHHTIRQRTYRILCEPDPDGDGWIVSVPAIPGVLSWAKDKEDVHRQAADALSGYLAVRIADQKALPKEPKTKEWFDKHFGRLPFVTWVQLQIKPKEENETDTHTK